MKKPKIMKSNMVLCGRCNNPIHLEEFGGVVKGKFYHAFCLEMEVISDGSFLNYNKNGEVVFDYKKLMTEKSSTKSGERLSQREKKS